MDVAANGNCREKYLEKSAKPFLKWAGGKSQLLPQLVAEFPPSYGRYFEPFVGGGAVFFHLGATNSYISDVNEELINAYRVIRADVSSLIRELRKHKHDRFHFYQLREADRKEAFKKWSPARRAARLIYLNKTCFNGLYRVNSQGYFNVPFGDYKNPKFLDEEILLACSKVLSGTEINLAPYFAIENKVKRGDFVYFDPPYAPLSLTSSFTSYTKGGFGTTEQRELRDLCERLDRKGVKWMLSNSSAPLILELYKSFNLKFVPASRAINSRAERRGKVNEVIVKNY